MHIIDSYALNCGLKISKPYIYEKFTPIPHEKYIALDVLDKSEAKHYSYWQEVIFLINDALAKESIKIIQIGDKNEAPLIDTLFLPDLNFNQKAYIIKNSLLYAGIDSALMHVASHYDIPIVALYCNSNPKNTGPYFNTKKSLIIESPKIKPSFNDQEMPKTINKIKPEEIAKGILNSLNINSGIKRDTLFMGDAFHASITEMVPDSPVDIRPLNIPFINVRMDYLFNQQVLAAQLEHFKCAILTDKPISIDIFKKYKENLVKLYLILDENTDFKYLEALHSNNIDFNMISFLENEKTNKLKIHTMDYGIIAEAPDIINVNRLNDFKKYKNLKFRSSKLILGNGKAYPSFYHYKNNINFKNNNLEIMDFVYNDDLFAKDLDYYSIFQA